MITAASRPDYKTFKLSGLIVGRFTFRRTVKMALIWGMVFGLTSLSSISGFHDIYKTPQSKANLVASFGHNTGLNALFGVPDKLGTAAGFTTWRIMGLAMLIGSIWGLLTATKNLRGEEEAGRWEMFLSGRTTGGLATVNSLAGMILGLLPLVLLPALLTYAGGRIENLNFGFWACLFYGLALSASAALFMSVGALASQLAPIRRRAALYSSLIFGASLIIRAAGDADSGLSWLTSLSPLGWVEKLHPLTGPQPVWLLPIGLFCLLFGAAAVYIAGRRDLGASVLADNDTAETRRSLLGNSFGLSLRLEKNSVIGWTLGAGFVGLLYGYISKSAVSVFKSSAAASKAFGKIAGQAQVKGVETFLGVVFLLIMVVIMVEATSLVGAIRSEEADGYLDNLLVRRTSRLGWLGGRLAILISALIISAGLGTILAWVAVDSQHLGIGLSEMLKAGLNILPAGLFVAGLGLLVFGFWPRLTTTVMYAIIAWSFLLEMIGSAINLNHYILDASVLHHVALAPAVSSRWPADAMLLSVGIIMGLIGLLWFNRRDLQGE